MKSSVSVTEVAARAGVSLGTVSNVLNRPGRVAVATRQRVLKAIEELGYVRNEAARLLRAGQSRTIGFIVLDVGNPFFTDLAAGIEDAATAAGLSLMLCNSGENVERERHYLDILEQQRSYGILITPLTDNNAQLDAIRRRGIPVVLVDRRAGRRQCSVSVDDVIGGELAMAHLLEAGHETVAFVGGPISIQQVDDRLAGARQAIRTAGLSENHLTVVETDALKVASGRAAGERLAALPATRRPTAVFCANDLIALGVLQEMTKRHVSVPDELAIVGYDDIDFAAAAAVPLTSIRQPRRQLGQAAAALLMEEADGPDSHEHRQVVFEPELVVRDSSKVTTRQSVSPRRPAANR